MQRRSVARLAIAAPAIVVALAAGCGDSDGGGYGSRDDANEPAPTATATTPAAPPGAMARECGETTVAGTTGLRVTGIGCDVGRGIVAAWTEKPACSRPADASRYSCSVYGDYRCLGAVADAGVAVSCARPGSSAAFLARPS